MKEIVLSFVIAIFCVACDKKHIDEPTYKEKAQVTYKLFFKNIEDEHPYLILKHNYSHENNLESVVHYPGDTTDHALIRELYDYSSNNLLENKYGYHFVNDSQGWLLNDSTHYCYWNSTLLIEEIYYSSSWSTPARKLVYKYLDSSLIAVSTYLDLQFTSYTTFHYSEGNCFEERTYMDSLEQCLASYTLHEYEDDLKLRTDFYTSEGNKFQVILFTYDADGNLLFEDSQGTDFPISRPVDYYCQYIY
ncbi:MAG: hypothetical protein V2B15_05155 [Bacteroidota bacterium]